jgi:hypothetical protein
MQSFIKGIVWPFITVHYIIQVDASMQGYSKGIVGPFIEAYHNG